MIKFYGEVTVPQRDNDYGVSYRVKLKHNAGFWLTDCYLCMSKNSEDEFIESDSFVISYFAKDDDKKFAEQKIIKAMNLLVYLTRIPYELENISKIECDTLPNSNVVISKRKTEMIDKVNETYSRIKTKKSLLAESLQLFSSALKYDYQFNYNDDAFFSYFRIIEKISKDDFEINKISIDKGKDKIQIVIQELMRENYNVTLSNNNLENVTGEISKSLYEKVFNNIYSKISMCLNKRCIVFDPERLGEVVKLRNKLAHGDLIDMEEYATEVSFVRNISISLIKHKFFGKIKKVYLDSTYLD